MNPFHAPYPAAKHVYTAAKASPLVTVTIVTFSRASAFSLVNTSFSLWASDGKRVQ